MRVSTKIKNPTHIFFFFFRNPSLCLTASLEPQPGLPETAQRGLPLPSPFLLAALFLSNQLSP